MDYEEYEEPDGRRLEAAATKAVSNAGIKISVEISAAEIVESVSREIESDVSRYMRNAMADEVKRLLTVKSYYQKEGEMNEFMRSVIKEVIKEKFDVAYPDAVTNQLNTMVEEIKKVTLLGEDSYKRERTIEDMKSVVRKKIDEMLTKEITPIVKAEASQMQERVQAMFAQNFIKTMIPLGLREP